MIKWTWAILLVWALAGQAETRTVALCGVDWPPFTYASGHRIVRGISYDIYREAFKRLDLTFRADVLPWPRCLREVEQGQYDAVIDNAGLSPYVFGRDPTAIYPLAVFVRADYPVEHFSWDDMDDTIIGMVRGYDYTPLVRAFDGWHPRYFTTDEQMLRVLDAGHIDYALGDLFSVPILSDRIDARLRPLKPWVDSTLLYLAFNADRADLMARYDAVIHAMVRDGTLDRIYRRYLPYTYHDILRMNADIAQP